MLPPANAVVGSSGVAGAHLIVRKNGVAVVLVPDFEAEPVHATAVADLTVGRREHETVVAGPIDYARAFVPRFGPGDDEPIIVWLVEIRRVSFRAFGARLSLRRPRPVKATACVLGVHVEKLRHGVRVSLSRERRPID